MRACSLAAAPATALAPLALYPNPARRHFTVPLPPAAPAAGLRLRLLDALGREVSGYEVKTLSASKLDVSCEGLPAGLYLVQVQGPGGYRQAQRLVLE